MRLLKMFRMVMYFILICLHLIQDISGQRIQLFPYNETKNCNISLVEENDRILMYGKVDFSGNIPASSVVNFEIKRKTDTSFHFLFFLKVPEDCDKVFYYCNCLKTDDLKVFKLFINITALTVNSETYIRAELIYRETSFFSEIRQLPIVYGFKTESVVVYANDQVVHFQKTDVSIHDTQVTIVSTCREKFAQDCKLQLMDLETGALLKSGKEMIVCNTNIKGRSKLNLKYSVCNIERNISFSITTNKTNSNCHLLMTTNPVVFILSTFFILILTMMFSFFIFVSHKKFIRKIQRLNSKRSSEYMQDDDIGEESQYLITETRDLNRESNENSLQKGNTRKSDDQQKKTTSITDVPIRYRDTDFQKLLGVLSQLTCRIQLKRHLFSTHSKNIGCGLVTSLVRYFNGVGINTVKTSESRVCPCPKCLRSKSPSDSWADIFITSSSRILKNTNYHKKIICVLSTADNVTTELRNLNVEHNDAKKSGRCVLKHVSCDRSLINKLQVLQEERSRLEEKVQELCNQNKDHDRIYFALVYREDGTKYLRTGVWSYGKTKYNVRTYHYDPEIPFTNIGAPVVLLGYSHEENEYNHTRNLTGEYLSYNISSSQFAVVFSQKVKTD